MSNPNPGSITVIILTYNEVIHLERCIKSAAQVAERIIIVDSLSTDDTQNLARSLGAEVFENPFQTQSQQFQWALDNIPVTSDWILRMDADEYFMPELVRELKERLPNTPAEITGYYVKMRVYFLDQWIKRGYYPMVLLRLWRNGVGYIQQKWMDEHTLLRHGEARMLAYDMVDHNLNHLGWWTEKHNKYSIREATERLNKEYHFMGDGYDNSYQVGNKKKWYKSLYLKLPLFIRPFLYFFYRYFFRLGFLEGKAGLVWHILQGFWFQFLVDAKIYQIKHIANSNKMTVKDVLIKLYGLKI